MKLKSVALLFFLALPLNVVTAQYNTGLGFRLGDFTALNWKYWRNNQTAFDASLAWNIESFWFAEANYLIHWRGYIDESVIYPYIGHGAFTGKSSGATDVIIDKNVGWFFGGSGRAGISLPIWRSDIAIETGYYVYFYPKLDGIFFLSTAFRFWF